MSPDGLQEQPRETGAPAASLTLVRVQRRRSSLQPSRKAGDLTQQLMETKATAPVATPASAPIAAPAPAPVATRVSEPAAPPIAALPVAEAPPPEPPVAEPAHETATALIALPPPALPVVELPQHETMVDPPALFVDDEFVDDEPEPLPPSAIPPVIDALAEPSTEPAAELPPVEDQAGSAEDQPTRHGADALIDYWDELAGDRLFPAFAELDRASIAQYWPNSVLLSFGAGDMPRMTRLGEPDGEVEYNLMVTDWILSRGRQAAERAEALEEEQRFPVGRGRARYRLVLLPCSNDGSRVDHMLCHVSRLADPKLGAVGAFKRWLAS